MDPCYIVFAAFCFSPVELTSVEIQRDRGAILEAEYLMHDITVVDAHHVKMMNQKKVQRFCIDHSCVYYHQYCEVDGSSEYCDYELQRSDYCETIKLRLMSKENNLIKNSRSSFSFFLDSDKKVLVGLNELDFVSPDKEPPRYHSRKELKTAQSNC